MKPPVIRLFMRAAFTASLLSIAVLPDGVLAVEGDNPFKIGAPPVPPYDPEQRLIIAEPPDGSVILQAPERILVQFRRFDFDLNPSSLALWIDGVEVTESLRFWIDSAWIESQAVQSLFAGDVHINSPHEIIAEIFDDQGLLYQTITHFTILLKPCPGGCPWPFDPTGDPKVVSNLMEDWQSFGSPYWHSGLDIRIPAGTTVRSTTDGTVVKVVQYKPDPLYWEIAVQDPQGYIWQYHHVEESSIAVMEGQPVNQGDVLAEVITWPYAMNGIDYHHMHLNVVRWEGVGPVPEPYVDGFRYFNPLNFLTKGTYTDAISPFTFDVFFAPNASDTAFAADSDPGEPILSGDVDILARLRDQMTTIPPILGQPYELGIYDLAYSVEPINTPCGVGSIPRTRLARFDVLPGGLIVATRDQILRRIYKQTLYGTGVSGTATDFDYGQQQFFYTLTNTHNGFPDDVNGFWDTDATPTLLGPRYPDGEYEVHIFAKDNHGNETVTPVQVTVANGLDYLGICPNFIDRAEFVHPLDLVSTAGESTAAQSSPLPMHFGPMMEGSAFAQIASSEWPAWYFDMEKAGFRVGIGLLEGSIATAEYLPYLGDVILDVPAEVQILPLSTGQFDPSASSTNPVSLRLSTRRARNPISLEPYIGRPASYGGIDFSLVMAALIQAGQETFTLKTRAPGGSQAKWIVDTSDSSPTLPSVPQGLVLIEASPNPFNPRVSLRLTSKEETYATVGIFDIQGRRVRDLFRGRLQRGVTYLQWNGTDGRSRRQPSGIYVVRVQSGEDVSTKKLVLVQ